MSRRALSANNENIPPPSRLPLPTRRRAAAKSAPPPSLRAQASSRSVASASIPPPSASAPPFFPTPSPSHSPPSTVKSTTSHRQSEATARPKLKHKKKFLRPASRRQSTPLATPTVVDERQPSPTSDSEDPLLLRGLGRAPSLGLRSRSPRVGRGTGYRPFGIRKAVSNDRDEVTGVKEEEEVARVQEEGQGGDDWARMFERVEFQPDAYRGHGIASDDDDLDEQHPLISQQEEENPRPAITLSNKLRAFKATEAAAVAEPHDELPAVEVVPYFTTSSPSHLNDAKDRPSPPSQLDPAHDHDSDAESASYVHEVSRDSIVPLAPSTPPPNRRTSLVSLRVPTPARLSAVRGGREKSFSSQRSDGTAWSLSDEEDDTQDPDPVVSVERGEEKGKSRMKRLDTEEEEMLTSLPPTSSPTHTAFADLSLEEGESFDVPLNDEDDCDTDRVALNDSCNDIEASPTGDDATQAVALEAASVEEASRDGVVVAHQRGFPVQSQSKVASASRAPQQHGTRITYSSPTRPAPTVVDVRMHSPIRTAAPSFDVTMASPQARFPAAIAPTSIEKLRLGGVVSKGRSLLAGKLPLFDRPSTPGDLFTVSTVPQTTTDIPSATPAPLEYHFERPYPVDPRAPPSMSWGPSVPASNTPPAYLLNAQSHTFTPQPLSSASITTSSRRSHSRPRPSHPTLPVVEISSTDPKAAARAAAILKVYHEYVEQGLEVPERHSSDDDDEDERKQMLEVAVKSVRRGSSLHSLPASTMEASRCGPTSTPTPSSSRVAEAGSSPGTSVPAPPRDWTAWTSSDWRRLERAVVRVTLKARRESARARIEDVVEAFLEGEGLSSQECSDSWALDKLITRVKALQERRARDFERRSQASSVAVTARVPSSLDSELRKAWSQSASSATATRPQAEEDDESESGDVTGEDNNEEAEEYDSDSPSDSGSEPDNAEDTFEHHPTRLASNGGDARFHPPLALTSARFAHLYDDRIAKPPAPIARPAAAAVKYREATPEPHPSECSQVPSSASKIFSFIGSFIRSSSVESHVSASRSPEPEMREMVEVGTRPVSVSTPSNAALLAPRPKRLIRSLPNPVVTRTVSTLRRQSSGEGRVWNQIQALEEAESSREEDAKFQETLQPTGAIKRSASVSDMRGSARIKLVGLGVVGASPAMIPSGTRALDRPIGTKLPKRKFF